ASVGRPRRRTLVAIERQHALGRATARADDEEIEALAAIGGKRDPSAVWRPCRLSLRSWRFGQLGRVATIGLRDPDAVEHDDGEPLAIRRPRRIPHPWRAGLRARRDPDDTGNSERDNDTSYVVSGFLGPPKLGMSA